MHEMSYMIRLVDEAVGEVEKHGGRVLKMCVSVGEMTGVLPEYLYKYYPEAVKGTILEGSELSVETVEARVRCEGCGGEYRPTRENGYACPVCGNTNGRIIAGRDVVLERLELEDIN